MSALLILHVDDDRKTSIVKFAYRDGEMSGVTEQITDYLVAHGLGESVWEGVAGDRLRTILEQRAVIRDMDKEIREMRSWSSLVGYPAEEVVK